MPTLPSAWMRTLNSGLVSPAWLAAIQYGISTTKPTAAATTATGSHHPAFLNRPHVAAVNSAIVTSARTCVMDHATPFVDTPGLANEGVSHKKVVPNRNRATPPRFRVVNMANHLRTETATPPAPRPGSTRPRQEGLSRPRVLPHQQQPHGRVTDRTVVRPSVVGDERSHRTVAIRHGGDGRTRSVSPT